MEREIGSFALVADGKQGCNKSCSFVTACKSMHLHSTIDKKTLRWNVFSMRYYKIRHAVSTLGQPKVGVIAVPLREIESRLSEEIRDAYGTERANLVLQKVRDNSVIVNKSYAEKAVFIQNSPIVCREMFREMFPEYKVIFKP